MLAKSLSMCDRTQYLRLVRVVFIVIICARILFWVHIGV